MMSREWTKAQSQAIESRNGTVLVSAAAGSGKTAVLVERVIQRITDANHPVDIEKLLIVTFTKAAASEMKERIAKRLSELIKEQPHNQYLKRQKMYLPNAQISTMDSFCGKLVKDNFEQVGIAPDYTLLSDIEHDMLKREVADEVLEELYSFPEEETKDLLELFTTGKSDTSLVESILSLYEFAIASPNPKMWIENAFADYHKNLRVHETKWGKYSLQRLKEVVEYTKINNVNIYIVDFLNPKFEQGEDIDLLDSVIEWYMPCFKGEYSTDCEKCGYKKYCDIQTFGKETVSNINKAKNTNIKQL
jgi:ATP-dependent helicase/nuclease subunit A